MPKKDYFDVLELDEDASLSEIKTQYRRLAKKWHPDVNREREAAKKFEEVKEAYDFLVEFRKTHPEPPRKKKFSFTVKEPKFEFRSDDTADGLSFSEFSTEGTDPKVHAYDSIRHQFSKREKGMRRNTKILFGILGLWFIMFIAVNIGDLRSIGNTLFELVSDRVFLNFALFILFFAYIMRAAYVRGKKRF